MPAGNRRPHRIFSLSEANGALPLVMRITKDIVDCNRRISELYCEAHDLVGIGRGEEAETMRQEIQELFATVEAHVEELEQIGCVYRDRAKGLVDFPARLGSRLVYLCWRLGEREILYWHEVQAGFAGRQPIGSYVAGT